MHPIRLNVRHAVTLLQKEDVAGNFRTGVVLKRIVRQTDSPDQIGPLGQILADGGVFLIHRAFTGDKSNNAARPDLIQRLSEEIIVDQPVIFVVLPVRHLEVAEGDVADGHIEEAVRHLHPFKARHGDTAVLIELSRDPSADAVNLHAVNLALRHAVWQHPDEVTHAAGRLQDIAPLKAHLRKRLIHGLDDNRRGIKSGQGAGPSGGILVLIQ
ncbi:unknown [Firmicutes bacterium CAG:137]|nr:unknown [Firmicutes bacterium CAG:137]